MTMHPDTLDHMVPASPWEATRAPLAKAEFSDLIELILARTPSSPNTARQETCDD